MVSINNSNSDPNSKQTSLIAQDTFFITTKTVGIVTQTEDI